MISRVRNDVPIQSGLAFARRVRVDGREPTHRLVCTSTRTVTLVRVFWVHPVALPICSIQAHPRDLEWCGQSGHGQHTGLRVAPANPHASIFPSASPVEVVA